MTKPLELNLTEEERTALEEIQNHDPKPYMRERASALLKISSGLSGRMVAFSGLNKKRALNTVYGWFHRYKGEGIEGLKIRPGRGRKPSFSPSVREGRSEGGDTSYN